MQQLPSSPTPPASHTPAPRRAPAAGNAIALHSAVDPAVGHADFDQTAVTQRLLAEFAGQHAPATVRSTVRDCVADITAVPALALAELVERCARQRLTDLRDQGKDDHLPVATDPLRMPARSRPATRLASPTAVSVERAR